MPKWSVPPRTSQSRCVCGFVNVWRFELIFRTFAPAFANVPAKTASSPMPPMSSVDPLRSMAEVPELSSPLSASVAFGATASDSFPLSSLMVERAMWTVLERIRRPSATVVGPESATVSS
jgi:hypothetical protein